MARTTYLDLARLRPVHQGRGFIMGLGRATLEFLGAVGELHGMFRQVVESLWRNRPAAQVFGVQLYHIGFLSLPIVLVTGASMGLVMAVQSYATLHRFNAENIAGAMVMYSLVTQIGPSMTALLVAGRVGSNIAAEIGTMKVTEQIDALRVMGTDPVAYLVAPRVLALTLLMPLLGALAGFCGIWAGAGLLTGLWGVDAGAYWHLTRQYVSTWDVVMGVAKCPVLGLFMGLIACRAGMLTKGGATGVGESCTRAVVQGCMMVLVMNFVLTLLTNKLFDLFLR